MLKAFNPVTYHHIWNEFNFVEVSLSLMIQNYATGTDLTCHSDLDSISTQLLVARLSAADRDAADRKLCLSLVDHNLKLANIFHHVFHGQKPLFIPKGQKIDIFMNTKEVHALNSRGYFGNDYFYLKIYKMIKLMHDNFKVSQRTSLERLCLRILSFHSTDNDHSRHRCKAVGIIAHQLAVAIDFAGGARPAGRGWRHPEIDRRDSRLFRHILELCANRNGRGYEAIAEVHVFNEFRCLSRELRSVSAHQ